MPPSGSRLRDIKTFSSLVKYLRDELGWPIDQYSFDDLTFDWDPGELGIDPKNAAKIEVIKQLRPLASNQPWGIFFVKFEPGRLPVVALRRILNQLVLKKRATARVAEQRMWKASDLLFISSYGEGEDREITFAHFRESPAQSGLAVASLRVLGWDGDDTSLKLDAVASTLETKLKWTSQLENDVDAWRRNWSEAFVLRPREVIRTSQDLAVRLADLAKGIRARALRLLEIESERGPLRQLHKAFQEALIHDLSAADFADMYSQTITYGLFSAAVSAVESGLRGALAVDHIGEKVPITSPFLRELLASFMQAGGRRGKIDFDELGVQEVVDLLNSPETHLADILRDFGNRTRQDDPVVHFYELFLTAYDKKRKIQRGVFYTPQPVVSYIVRSVHELLQTEFGLEDGLASTITWGEMAKRYSWLRPPEGVDPATPFVRILDPATGTATFLVEVIDVIYRTLTSKWKNEGLAESKQRATWNEYVSTALLPRLYGYELMMAPYAIAHMKVGLKLYETGYRFDSDQRVRIYLTNALEPPSSVHEQQQFEEWAPALAHEAQAVNSIKRTEPFTVVIGNPPYSTFGQLNKIPFILALLEDYKRGLEEKKLNLDDDYLKFFRLAQYILDCSRCGVCGMITNSSFLDGLVHRRMRESLLAQFTDGYIVDLHGSSRRRETTPDGATDQNVFDIQQGVAISLWLNGIPKDSHGLRHRELWGNREQKYHFLETHTMLSARLKDCDARPPQFFFIPQDSSARGEYEAGIPLTDVFSVIGSGLNTDRDELCIDLDKVRLSDRMQRAFSGKVDAEFIDAFNFRPSSSYDPVAAAKRQDFDPRALRVCIYRPFDWRHIYYQVGFTSRPVFDVQGQMLHPNLGLLVCRQSKEPFAVLVTRTIATHKIVAVYDRTSLVPLWLYALDRGAQRALRDGNARVAAFKSGFAKTLADRLQLRLTEQGLPQGLTAEDIFHYAYALFHSPHYRSRYSESLRSDFPRLPLTGDLALFQVLARLGGELVALHLLESPRVDQPLAAYVGPASAEVEKVSYAHDTAWLDKSQTRGFRGVPEAVWNFHVGGYQVCEKWLKDRKGRALSKDDTTHYQKVVVAIAETIRVMQEVDEVIEAHGGWPAAFQAGD